VTAIIKDRQTAVVQGRLQLNLVGGKEDLSLQGSGDEVAGVGRQVGDVADRSRPWSAGEAKGLAHQIGDVGLAVLPRGFGSLHEHGLQDKSCMPYMSTYTLEITNILLATQYGKTPANVMFCPVLLGS